jgi:hypothetical protein
MTDLVDICCKIVDAKEKIDGVALLALRDEIRARLLELGMKNIDSMTLAAKNECRELLLLLNDLE